MPPSFCDDTLAGSSTGAAAGTSPTTDDDVATGGMSVVDGTSFSSASCNILTSAQFLGKISATVWGGARCQKRSIGLRPILTTTTCKVCVKSLFLPELLGCPPGSVRADVAARHGGRRRPTVRPIVRLVPIVVAAIRSEIIPGRNQNKSA